MYTVNGTEFNSFLKAIEFANSIKADVVETSTGLRRWSPAKVSSKKKVRHVLVNADGSETEFSKVVR